MATKSTTTKKTTSSKSSDTIKYDTKTGKKLKAGQTTVVAGKTVKAGDSFSATVSSSKSSSSSSGGNSDVIKYDTNTGRELNPGESFVDKATGKTFTQGQSFSSSSSSSSSTPTTRIVVEGSVNADGSVNLFNPNTGERLKPGESVEDRTSGSSGASNLGATDKSTLDFTNTNLQFGDSGQEVAALQQYLNSQGAGLTVDGKFGEKTKAAVTALQTQKGLKADGIVGPQTALAIRGTETASTNSPTTTSPTTTSTTPTTQSTPTTTQPSNPQLGLLGAIADVATNTYSTKNSGLTLSDALDAAKKDTNIIAKYADMLKLDKLGFTQQLDELQRATSSDEQLRKTQFENDRRNLAENYAAAGGAYSGLRNRAQTQLGEQQSGIVSSSRSSLKNKLDALTTSFEKKYGTDATTAAKAQFQDPFSSANVSLSGLKVDGTPDIDNIAGKLAGNITGTLPIQKEADIQNKATSLYQIGQLPA